MGKKMKDRQDEKNISAAQYAKKENARFQNKNENKKRT